MRLYALLIALLFILPVATSLAVPLPRADHDVPQIEEVQGDITDARLVYLLGTTVGYDLNWPPAHATVPDLPLSAIVLSMGLRAGMLVTPADVAAFDSLDARISTPVAQLLVAMDAAWTLRDQAFARLSHEEQVELLQLHFDNQLTSPRFTELRANVQPEPLYDAAILLLDTLENEALPQLQAAAELDIWPATAVADPVGVLRIGGTGNDEERINRILQIDPRGDDTYRNNAGGGTILVGLINNPTTFKAPVALSLDLSGDDQYLEGRSKVSQGGGSVGLGILYDLSGNDAYDCFNYCQGGGATGIGILRDFSGGDTYLGSSRSTGGGDFLGILREEHGDDTYWVNEWGGGASELPAGMGLLWDRAGEDNYQSRVGAFADARYGWGGNGGRGWFIDEDGADFYETDNPIFGIYSHGCNGCEWLHGEGFNGFPVRGRGNDDAGGLYRVMQQDRESLP